jgi:hypothetical protein
MRHSIGRVARVDKKGRGARVWMILHEDMSSCHEVGACTYTHTNSTHDTYTLQFLPVLFWHHILVDGVESERTVVVPPQTEVQDGDLICGG